MVQHPDHWEHQDLEGEVLDPLHRLPASWHCLVGLPLGLGGGRYQVAASLSVLADTPSLHRTSDHAIM